MRVTRKMLERRVERLNAILNRPVTGWTRIPSPDNPDAELSAKLRANVGHFLLESNSPGDGWTRYTLTMIVSDGGGEINVSHCCTLQEMWAYLCGVFDVLDSMPITFNPEMPHTFAKYPDYIQRAATGA
jgi:hypothetical protein